MPLLFDSFFMTSPVLSSPQAVGHGRPALRNTVMEFEKCGFERIVSHFACIWFRLRLLSTSEPGKAKDARPYKAISQIEILREQWSIPCARNAAVSAFTIAAIAAQNPRGEFPLFFLSVYPCSYQSRLAGTTAHNGFSSCTYGPTHNTTKGIGRHDHQRNPIE